MSVRAFSLIELLVTLVIIALLVGLLLPALGAGRSAARSVACQSQIRQVAQGTLFYAANHRDFLPRSSHSALVFGVRTWSFVLTPYVGYDAYDGPPHPAWWPSLFNGLYRCPDDDRRELNRWSYGKNVYPELTAGETADPITGKPGPTWWRVMDLPRPSATVLYGELRSHSAADHLMAHFWPQGGQPEVDALRHRNHANYAYLDGHARSAAFNQTYDPAHSVDQWNPASAR